MAAALGIGADMRSDMRSFAWIPKHRNLEGVAMESSRDGVIKLNGHGAGVNEGSRAFEPQKPQSSGLVDELAQAMKMARDSLERPLPSNFSAAAASPLPAMPAPRGLFDDEEDDAAMPIPSTWRAPPEPPKQGRLRDQIRAAAFGFATGLAVVIPVVLFLTGRLDNLSLDGLFGEGGVISAQTTERAAPPATTAPQVQQRVVATTVMTPVQRPPAVTQPVEPVVATLPVASPAPASWDDAIAEGKRRILAGDITGGREALKPAVEANEPEAIMAMAETFDPNMLAAWGVRDVAADVARARDLYQKAMSAGITTARARLQGLN